MNPYDRELSLGLSGMRGVVGAGLNPASAMDFAAACGTLLECGSFLVAADSRGSSKMFKDAVTAALCGCGCRVLDGGLMHGGMVQFLVRELQLDGALYISGGHQRSGCNSIIPIGGSGAYLNYIQQRELFDLFHSRVFHFVKYDKLHKVEKLSEKFRRKYWDFLESASDAAAIRKKKLKVAADWCNGVDAKTAETFGKMFGLKLISINDKLSPIVPRNPEPGRDCGSPVGSLMQPLQADAGLIFCSDLSRMSLCTEAGTALSEEYTFPLALDYYLDRHSERKCKVFTNICSSRMLDDVAARHGADLEKCKVGQSSIIDNMKTYGGDIGGEGSGSFVFSDRLWGFDGLLMASLVLESLANGYRISEKVTALPNYTMLKETLPCRQGHAYSRLRQIKNNFADGVISESDGWRFDWKDGFLSLRLSTTESVVRIISESASAKMANERLEKAKRFLEQNLN